MKFAMMMLAPYKLLRERFPILSFWAPFNDNGSAS